jgi:hypothetical protein
MKRISAAGFLLAVLLCVPAARGQQATPNQDQSTPIAPDQPLSSATAPSSGSTNDAGAAPAGRSIPGSGADTSQETNESAMLPLSGSVAVTSNISAQPRNYFDAGGLVSGSADSAVISNQVINNPGTSSWGGIEVIGGEVSYNRSWQENRFTMSYLGGATLYEPGALFPAAMYHALSLEQDFGWKRLKLSLIDQFSYSPNSLFGGAGIGGPGLLAETGQAVTSTLTPSYASGSSILTGQTRLVSNSALAQIAYNISPRSSFTVTGDYGLLDYAGGGYISSHDYVVGGGYNHMLTPKDTLAVTYTFSQDLFTGTPQKLAVQQINVAYSHVVTERIVFQIAGGPEFVTFHDYTPSVPSDATWSLNAGVEYRLRRTNFAAAYTHGANAGSGVFFGSISQTAGGSVNHQFSRFLVGAVNAGYSFNHNLAPTTVITNNFNNWYASGSVGRQLGRFTHISINYGAQQQPYNGICPVASCGTNHVIQTFGVALDVHLRPIGSIE